MIAGVADTHTVIWYLLKDPRLSDKARRFIDDAAATGNEIMISPITLAEIVYLVEKNRVPADAYSELKKALADADYVIAEAPFTAEIVEAMRKVPRAEVPDLPDRIVAATAVYFRVPVLSRDSRISTASVVQTVW
jgi:PIN domain nuclease of toxin-antitoxin system